MTLTSQQKDIINEHIHNNSNKECVCPICHKDDWIVTDELSHIQIEGKKLLSAYILCNNCGFLMNHNVHKYISG
jgi:C4-type Zn-finger protein